jgi:hypothetical protein
MMSSLIFYNHEIILPTEAQAIKPPIRAPIKRGGI